MGEEGVKWRGWWTSRSTGECAVCLRGEGEDSGLMDEETGEAFLLRESKGGKLLVGEGDLELLLVKEQSLASPPTEPSLFGGQLLLLLLGRGCSCT